MKTAAIGSIAAGVVIVVMAGIFLGTETEPPPTVKQPEPPPITQKPPPPSPLPTKTAPQQPRTIQEETSPVRSDPEVILPAKTTQSSYSLQDCSGSAKCIIGKVTQVVDGDTIKVNSQSIRFALASAPELDEFRGVDARNFIETLCPVGSEALVDEDDGQTQGSYGRIIAVIHCNDVNLNEELLDSGLGYLASEFCDDSEFASTKWAKKHGCQDSEPQRIVDSDCDASYPDFCIASSPPDLDCKDIPQKRFTVLPPDPHRFDGDKDGIGCES